MDVQKPLPKWLIVLVTIVLITALIALFIAGLSYDACMFLFRWLNFGIGGLNPAKIICAPWRAVF